MDAALKVIGALVLVALVLLAGLLLIANAQRSQAPPPIPEFGWAPSPQEIVAIDSAGVRTWSFSRSGKIRLQISSDSPVSFMLGDPETIKSSIVPSNGINSPRLRPSGKCAGADTLQSEVNCDAKAGDVLIVQDSRGLKEDAMAAVGLFARNTSAISAAQNKSRVTLNMATWRCVRNC